MHTIKQILSNPVFDKSINIYGWIRNKRESKNVIFLNINDGTTINNIQLVLNNENDENFKKLNIGASIHAIGTLVKSKGSQQSLELLVSKINILGKSDPNNFPIQPKKHSLEFLRSIPHFRLRTNTFGAIFRIKNKMCFAIHQFFQKHDFILFNTPIITSIDAEGAGEMFQVTSLDLKKVPFDENKQIDFKKDFYGQKTNLTVSGQIAGEIGATALNKVYTFGPTFRAENSNTTRHLSEFWMIEPEISFFDLKQDIDLAESFIKYIIKYVLDNCGDDIEFLNNKFLENQLLKPKEKRTPKSLIENLNDLCSTKYEIINYSDAFKILKDSKPNKKKKFKYPIIDWGLDFKAEHEKF